MRGCGRWARRPHGLLRVTRPIDGRPKSQGWSMVEHSWLQVLSHVDPRFGGIATVVPRIAEATGCGRLAFSDPDEQAPPSVTELARAPRGRLRWMFSPGLRRNFREVIRSCGGLHIHGLWEEHSALAAALAESAGRPYVMAAHGMLDRWAL